MTAERKPALIKAAKIFLQIFSYGVSQEAHRAGNDRMNPIEDMQYT